MFSSSLRRVAQTCPNAALSARPSPSHGSIAAFTTRSRSHQRRNSSSKPPTPPNNGSPPIPTASVKQVGAPRSDKRPGAESRLSKRKVAKSEKAEAAKNQDEFFSEWTRTLPSVPSTQHLNPKDVYVASFFSTHRPISITGPLPPETQMEDIDKIFQIRPKSQRRKTQDVIYTISSAVQNLDEQVATQQQAAQHDEGVSQRADIIKALTQHNNSATNPGDSNTVHMDGQSQNQTSVRVGENVKLVIQALARQFRPFNPPPVPTAAPEVEFFEPEKADAEEAQAKALEAEVESQDPSTRSQLQDFILQNGTVKPTNTFFTSSVPRAGGRTRRGVHLVQDVTIRDVRKGVEKMYTISVKRQRRLKMKKHKYKKLQRKTRNLRRRQGKI